MTILMGKPFLRQTHVLCQGLYKIVSIFHHAPPALLFHPTCPLAAQLDVPGLYCNEYNSRNAMVQKGEGSRLCAVWVTVSQRFVSLSSQFVSKTQQAGLWWAIAELWRD